MILDLARTIRARLMRKIWSSPLQFAPEQFRAESTRDPSVISEIASYEQSVGGDHWGGTMTTRTLLRIEQHLPAGAISSAETGCGKSTIFFSRISDAHKVFCLDDRNDDNSSVAYCLNCPATRPEKLDFVYGPTQLTLPRYEAHVPYDLVLIDGPHGYPFPELEYYYFYPHLKTGGLLVVDDIHIPTIGRFAEFLCEDAMFEKVEFAGSTAIFRRTDAPTFDPLCDGWWAQHYNRRRASFSKDLHLKDGKRHPPIRF